ncbi:MAG TPA: FixH family protein [Ktedonosporobacter sp.]|nr:FixH family protein [Ktedonosporobacter sp.]
MQIDRASRDRPSSGANHFISRRGLLTMFSLSTLLAACNSAAADTTVAPTPSSGLSATQQTSDNKFQIKLNVTPNHLGLNNFIVTVIDQNGKPVSDVSVTLYLNSIDMVMSDEILYLLPDGNNHFTSQGGFMMPGHWTIRVLVKTPDNVLHECRVPTLIHT